MLKIINSRYYTYRLTNYILNKTHSIKTYVVLKAPTFDYANTHTQLLKFTDQVKTQIQEL